MIITGIAVATTAGLTVAAEAQEPAKSASITHVFDGHETWVPFEDGMTVDADTRKVKGTSSGVSSVQIMLDEYKVGHNKIRDDGTFAMQMKNPPPPDTYTLTVYDCGEIVEKRKGACAVRGADLTQYDVLFQGTIYIMTPEHAELKKMETKYASMEAEMNKMQDEMYALQQQIAHHKNSMDERDVLVTDKTVYTFGERIYFSANGDCEDRVYIMFTEIPTVGGVYSVGASLDCDTGDYSRSNWEIGKPYIEYNDGRFGGWFEYHDPHGIKYAENWEITIRTQNATDRSWYPIIVSDLFTISIEE